MNDLEGIATSELTNPGIGFKNGKFAHILLSDMRFGRATLKVGPKEVDFRADPNILVQSSFFDNWFTANNLMDPIHLPDLDPYSVGIIINYLYTGSIILTNSGDNLLNVLLAANTFDLNDIKSTCLELLTNFLDAENCLRIREFAERNKLYMLLKPASEFVKKNFESLTDSDYFLNLPLSQVEDMVSNYKKYCTTSEEIFNAILHWVKFDKFNKLKRKSYIHDLLTKLNLWELFDNSPVFVKESFRTEPILQGTKCKQMYFRMIESIAVSVAIQNSSTANAGRPFENNEVGDQISEDHVEMSGTDTTVSGNSSWQTNFKEVSFIRKRTEYKTAAFGSSRHRNLNTSPEIPRPTIKMNYSKVNPRPKKRRRKSRLCPPRSQNGKKLPKTALSLLES